MKKMNLLAILAFVAGTAFAQSTWKLDKNHSQLNFTITHLGISDVDGGFKKFDATITSSKEDLSDAVFTVSAEIASIDTENDMRNGHLQGEGWFDAAKYPTLTFKSTSFTKKDGSSYVLKGDLTLHGVTKPVELMATMKGPVAGREGAKLVGFKFTGTIKRTDFGVGKPGNAPVSEEVALNGNAEFSTK